MLPEKQSLEDFPIDYPDSIPFIDFWKFYINFGYYLLILPFHLKKNPQSLKWEIARHGPQQVSMAL